MDRQAFPSLGCFDVFPKIVFGFGCIVAVFTPRTSGIKLLQLDTVACQRGGLACQERTGKLFHRLFISCLVSFKSQHSPSKH